MAVVFDFKYDPLTGRIVTPPMEPLHPDVIGLMDGYEDDIETIWIKGDPMPKWDPLATKNRVAYPGLFGIGGLPPLPEIFSPNWWLMIGAGLMIGAVLISKVKHG